MSSATRIIRLSATEQPQEAGSGGSLALIERWYQRSRQRRELARLDAWALADIGIDRETALAEARKPFWRA